jgi:hypothetical protein
MRIRSIVLSGLASAIGLFASVEGAHAGVIFDATSGATAQTGYITSNDMTASGTLFHHPSYPSANLIDGNLTTRVDTYSGTEVSPATGSDTAPLDFLGVVWGGTVSDIVAVRLHQFLYFDGGWFGTATGDTNAANGANDAAADAADAADVAAPTVQVTTDSGATWVGIAATDDYVSIVQPLVAANAHGQTTPPITFAFTAQSGINGIRLVGYGGGRSDVPAGRDEQGWVSAAEFEVGRFVATVPEPGSLALFTAGLVAVAGYRRRVRTIVR